VPESGVARSRVFMLTNCLTWMILFADLKLKVVGLDCEIPANIVNAEYNYCALSQLMKPMHCC